MGHDLLDDHCHGQLRIDIEDAVAEPLPWKLKVVGDDQCPSGRGLEQTHRGTVSRAMSCLVKTKGNSSFSDRPDNGDAIERQGASIARTAVSPVFGWTVKLQRQSPI
jgi:hypothetical protein